MDLPKKFKKYGDLFVHVTDRDGWYVYQRIPYMDDDGNMVSGVRSHFEVVKPVWRNMDAFGGARWMYPRASQWGNFGFSVGSVEAAVKKIEKLTNAS